MKQNHIDLEDWVAFVFDHDNRDWVWKHRFSDASWQDNTRLKMTHFVSLAENSQRLLRPFSDEQVGWGLSWLTSSFVYEIGIFSGTDGAPPELFERAIGAIGTLGKTLILNRCPRVNPTMDPDEIAGAYYMFWDVAPIWPSDPTDADRRLREICLTEMQAVLEIDHPVYQYHALHGLGHFALIDESRPQEIIDTWLGGDPRASEDVLEYARLARLGNIQ